MTETYTDLSSILRELDTSYDHIMPLLKTTCIIEHTSDEIFRRDIWLRKLDILCVSALVVLLLFELCYMDSWALALEGNRPELRQTTGVTCFYCQGSVTPEDCEMTTVCSPHEECVTHETVEDFISYNLGCKAKQVCDILRRFNRSGECEKCCSTSYCNNRLCKPFGLKETQCHMGKDLDDPHEAEKILTCEPGEVCYSAKVVTDEEVSRYYLGCSTPKACTNTTELLKYMSLAATQVERFECAECCSQSYCNLGLCR